MTITKTLKIGALLLLCSAVTLASDRKGYGDIEVLEVVSVYDADTFRVNIAGWPDLIGRNISIRADGLTLQRLEASILKRLKVPSWPSH